MRDRTNFGLDNRIGPVVGKDTFGEPIYAGEIVTRKDGMNENVYVADRIVGKDTFGEPITLRDLYNQ